MDVLSEKWVIRHLEIAHQVKQWSKDPNTQVGAVIVTKDGKPRSWGFNGIPSKVLDLPERFERPTKYRFFSHAETNAITLCESSVEDCVLFCTHMPCSTCARNIINSGISAVIVDAQCGFANADSFVCRNDESFECHFASLQMFEEAGVSYHEVDMNTKMYYDVPTSRIRGKKCT